MGVVLDLGGDSGVVVVPLVTVDSSVAVFIAKRREEINEYVVGGHFSRFNFGVVWCAEYMLKLFCIHCILTKNVKLIECSIDDLLSSCVGFTSYSKQELIVVNIAIFASVKVFEKNSSLFLGNSASQIFESPVELLLVK